MSGFIRRGVQVDRFYEVSGVDSVPDSARCPLDPEWVTVSFRCPRGEGVPTASYITIKGRRLRGKKTIGTYNQGGYSIRPDGTVEPDYKTGEPPAWVQAIVNQAINEHAEGVGLAPTLAVEAT
jgi:hypothetical protein